jgi:hypothetical protein
MSVDQFAALWYYSREESIMARIGIAARIIILVVSIPLGAILVLIGVLFIFSPGC